MKPFPSLPIHSSHAVIAATLLCAALLSLHGCSDDDQHSEPDIVDDSEGSSMPDSTDVSDTPDIDDVPDSTAPDSIDADNAVELLGPDNGEFGTIAGSAATGFVDGSNTESRFSGPAGAVASADGSLLYIADTFNNTIRRANLATGAVETIAGVVGVSTTVDGTGAAATFQGPRAIAVSPDGSTLYIADAGTVRTMDTTTFEVETVAGAAGATDYVDATGGDARFGYLQHAYAMSDDGETLYIIDRSNARLRAMDTSTYQVTTLAGNKGEDIPGYQDGFGTEATFSSPGGMALYQGKIYIADMGNNAIRVYDIATTEVTTLAGIPGTSGNEDGGSDVATFQIIQGVTAYDGKLYVVGFNNTLREVDIATGQVDTILGVYQESAAIDGDKDEARLGISFNSALLLEDEGTGSLLFMDHAGSSFRKIDLQSLSVTTLFGAKNPTGHRDGSADQAMFDGLDSVVCDEAGHACYLSDTHNHVIRVLDRVSGDVSTLAGAPNEPGSEDGAAQVSRFAEPTGLALDEAEGLLYVADTGNYSIRVIDLASQVLVSTLAGSADETGSVDATGSAARFDTPEALALTSDGLTLYVADPGNATIRSIATGTGAVSTAIGVADEADHIDGDASSARLSSPNGLALSVNEDKLFVSQYNGTIRSLSLGDTVELDTIAGTPDKYGVADGAFDDALFDTPSRLLVSPSGEYVYVVDGWSGTVRRLDLANETVSTWLGDNTLTGNGPTGVYVPWADATMYIARGIARAGDDVILTCEDAVVAGRPDETTW